MKHSHVLLASLAIVLCFPLCASSQDAAQAVTLCRDTFGVPHIYAETAAAAAFGLGYAQAEDRLDDIYKNVRTAIGAMAECFGPEHIEVDFIMRVVRNAEVCEAKWPEVPGHIREVCERFIDGVNTFTREHPERVPPFALELKPWHCAAIGRTMILQWPLGNLMRELGRKPETPHFASNCWAVAPSRSADGCSILLTDPHLDWESLAVFYECRVHGGELEMCGFCLVGSPVIAIGHNAHVGWACTTGGPDTSDVYVLKLNPDLRLFGAFLPTQYEYEKKWRYATLRLIPIRVRGEKFPRYMPAIDTIHGPLIAEPDTQHYVAYAGNTPYFDDMGLLEQSYKMVTARDAHEFYDALAMNHLMEQNVMFADRAGNIGYARVGRVPVRPGGYDWSRPVPGHTQATQWLGIHPLDDLVHIMNPPQGYMQNCNISPADMMEDSPLTADKYAPYIYNVPEGLDTPRGRRALQLLAADGSITKEEAMAIVMDAYDLLAVPWQQALRAAAAAESGHVAESGLAAAVDVILAWNGEFTQDSVAAPLVKEWRLACHDEVEVAAIADGRPLTPQDSRRLLEVLADTVVAMEKRYGKGSITWAETHQVGRNGQYVSYDGADFGDAPNLTETLRCVYGPRTPNESGVHIGTGGTMAAMLMFFHEAGIESYSCIPWGQSADPASPHYMDQGRALFARRKMKPTWFAREELAENTMDKKVLVVQ